MNRGRLLLTIWPLWSSLAAASLLLLPGLRADDAPPESDPLEKRLVEIAHMFEFTAPTAPRPIEIDEQPLLNWVNSTREGVQRGLVYVWENDGRPEIIGSAFSFVTRGQRRFKMQLHSLSQSELRATAEDDTVWTPGKQAITWKSFPDTPTPASNDRRRLTQMRLLARRFHLKITTTENEIDTLRLLPQPIHRYSSASHGIKDGAIFSFATGTDPDALLLMELAETGGELRYQYAFARFHYWAITATLDNTEQVWEAPADMTQMFHVMGDTEQFEKPYASMNIESYPIDAFPDAQ